MRKIFFYALVAFGASFFTMLLLRGAAAFGPEQPVLTGVAVGVAAAAILALFRWLFFRLFEADPSPKIYPIGAAFAALFALAAYLLHWDERLAWVVATGVLVAWWLLRNFVLARR